MAVGESSRLKRISSDLPLRRSARIKRLRTSYSPNAVITSEASATTIEKSAQKPKDKDSSVNHTSREAVQVAFAPTAADKRSSTESAVESLLSESEKALAAEDDAFPDPRKRRARKRRLHDGEPDEPRDGERLSNPGKRKVRISDLLEGEPCDATRREPPSAKERYGGELARGAITMESCSFDDTGPQLVEAVEEVVDDGPAGVVLQPGSASRWEAECVPFAGGDEFVETSSYTVTRPGGGEVRDVSWPAGRSPCSETWLWLVKTSC